MPDLTPSGAVPDRPVDYEAAEGLDQEPPVHVEVRAADGDTIARGASG